MKIKVSEATNIQLDWAMAKCEGALHPLGNVVIKGKSLWIAVDEDTCHYMEEDIEYSPSTDWSQGGPIIDREKIDCIADPNGNNVWMGRLYQNRAEYKQFGPTPLIAAMRCFVASKLGDEMEVPDELAN